MRRLFVFRPEPASRQTIRLAQGLGLDVVSLPLFELEAMDWIPPDAAAFDGILLTSANTLRMAGQELNQFRALPVHAVGEGTAVAAEVAGLGVATIGKGGVDCLLGALDPAARLLHLCGEDRRAPSVAGRSITTVAVYRARAKPEVFGLGSLAGQVAVLHSPKAARRLTELVPPAGRSTVRIAAISQEAAEAVGEGWQEVRTATSPNDTELLALAARLCET